MGIIHAVRGSHERCICQERDRLRSLHQSRQNLRCTLFSVALSESKHNKDDISGCNEFSTCSEKCCRRVVLSL